MIHNKKTSTFSIFILLILIASNCGSPQPPRAFLDRLENAIQQEDSNAYLATMTDQFIENHYGPVCENINTAQPQQRKALIQQWNLSKKQASSCEARIIAAKEIEIKAQNQITALNLFTISRLKTLIIDEKQTDNGDGILVFKNGVTWQLVRDGNSWQLNNQVKQQNSDSTSADPQEGEPAEQDSKVTE